MLLLRWAVLTETAGSQVQPLAVGLFALSIINAVYVFRRTRQYRLFQVPVESGPGTPSAQRVRVQSSPASSSPMRMLSDMLSSETAESRAYPDSSRDVWELRMWDPRPGSLAAMIYFSPLHVLLYLLELPLDPLDARPSVSAFKCLLVQASLSTLLRLLQAANDQRQRDAAVIQREVLNEYNAKFVQPRLHPVVRDVATQISMDDDPDGKRDFVGSGTPTTLIRRGFQTHPSPNYIKHVDPDSVGSVPSTNVMSPALFTPAVRSRHSDSFASSHQARSRHSAGVSPAVGPAASAATSSGFGGNLGAYAHANSPLKKATSMDDINSEGGFFSPRNSRELAAIEQREAALRAQRRASPLKDDRRRTTDASSGRSPPPEDYPGQAVNPFATKPRPNAYKYERFPSRR